MKKISTGLKTFHFGHDNFPKIYIYMYNVLNPKVFRGLTKPKLQ